MRFTSFIVAGIFAVAASAQSSTTGVSSTSVASSNPAQSSAVSEVEKCLAACDESDTDCRAHCIAVPSPDNANVNATLSCVADCPQGNGTAADNKAYAECRDGCIGQFFFTSTGTPNLATSKGGNSDTSAHVTQVPTTIVTDGSTIVTSVASTATGSSDDSNGPSTTSSGNGAAVYGPVGTIGAGLSLFGLLAGFIAL